jgi:ABC-type Fe3+/spermidine/putrescine transport system ATPase subunit
MGAQPRTKSTMPTLTITAIEKHYERLPVLKGISMAVPLGTITVLLGPSGCGKTTLLRIIAGLERADAGQIAWAGAPLEQVPPHHRNFGMMFQEYALFPHLDVAGNVGYGLRMRGLPAAERAQRVGALLEQVGLRGYERRRVYELSGGERQRVALARTLAPQPRLIMFDEPLAALDRELRERLQDELRTILRNVGVTALYVTHDQEEAFALADQIALLNAGQIEQYASPATIYARPASLWAARFLGWRNVISGTLLGDGRVRTPLGDLHGMLVGAAVGAVTVVIAPDAAGGSAALNQISGQIGDQQFRGRFTRISLHHTSDTLLELDLSDPPPASAGAVQLTLSPERVLIYPQ